ncbi:hypothetical protein VTN77DRAFT_3053 [Rasamsonia byssochlamydoides]|uniref:uncharacterized protein n=1 Tax=Rasamsonia byssochlamydoides TaxID=89139 RepID=UPI0037436C0C
MAPKRVRTVEGSCWPCKDRRVLCDLQRPRCFRCATEGRPCSYGKVRLRWCNGVAARGRFAGQTLPILDVDDHKERRKRDTGEDNFSSALLSLRPSDSLVSASAVTAEELMLYFEHEVVDRFNLSPGRIQVDLLSVYKDPALRQSVTAVANAHHLLYLRQSPHDAVLAKKKARLEAIQLFRKQLLAHDPPRTTSPSAFDLFVTNVLLCILDGVIDPDDEGAATYWHFRGGRAILSQWRLQEQLFQQKRGLPALMLSVFATMDLTYALLSGQDPYFHRSTWASFARSQGWWGTLPAGDPFLELMAILSRLAHLGHLIYATGQLPSGSEVQALLATLRGHDVVEEEEHPHSAISSSILSPSLMTALGTAEPLDRDQSWTVFCSAYRLTGLVYIYRVLFGLDVKHPIVQQATALGVQAICGVRLTGKLSHCLLFPTLVIGSHCQRPEQQKAIRATLGSTAAFLYFGSLRIMESFLEGVWERGAAIDWWECFDDISRKTFLF